MSLPPTNMADIEEENTLFIFSVACDSLYLIRFIGKTGKQTDSRTIMF